MTMSRSHSFRLASLRRASAFAGFMLVVFLMRIGIGMACEPHDLAELFGDPSPMALIVGVDDGAGLDPLADHGADHCRQCNCHHSVALPSFASISPTQADAAVDVRIVMPHVVSPHERHLRPPIV